MARAVLRVRGRNRSRKEPDAFATLLAGKPIKEVRIDRLDYVIDEGEPHESKVDRARIAGGARRFKVQYYEAGGFAELRFNILRR